MQRTNGIRRAALVWAIVLGSNCGWAVPGSGQNRYTAERAARAAAAKRAAREAAAERAAAVAKPDEDYGRPYHFAPGMPEADDFHPAETSGPAIAQGFGNQFAGIGLQLGYYLVAKEQPLALFGYGSLGTIGSADGWLVGWAGGVMGLYGHKHRWAVDLNFAMLGYTRLELHGATVAVRPLYGFSVSAGREWMWSTHLFFRVLIGVAHIVDTIAEQTWSPALTLGFGVKPW